MSLALITLIIITIINPLMRPTRRLKSKKLIPYFNINKKKNDSLNIKSKGHNLSANA